MMAACSVDGCTRASEVRGLCRPHYQRLTTTGEVGSGDIRAYQHWTRERRWELDELLDKGWSDERIAVRLGTTVGAIRNARQRFGIKARIRQGHTLTTVKRDMGVSQTSVERWIRDGRLEASRTSVGFGGRLAWKITNRALESFIRNPDHWHCWDVDNITDEHLRAFAQSVRGDVRYLSMSEVARRAGVSVTAIWNAIDSGTLPVRRAGRYLRIRESDVAAGIAERTEHANGPYSKRDDRQIVELITSGASIDDVAGELRRPVASVMNRCQLLLQEGKVR